MPGAAASAQPAPASVNVSGFTFLPGAVRVIAGQPVHWTNTSFAQHTITADDGSFDSGLMSAGDTFDMVFDLPGIYQYYCQLHGGPELDGMAATVIVGDPAGAQDTVQRTPDDYMPTEVD